MSKFLTVKIKGLTFAVIGVSSLIFMACAPNKKGGATSVVPSLASSGTESGGGGGDPSAILFLGIAHQIEQSLESEDLVLPNIDPANVTKVIAVLENSLNGPSEAHLKFSDDAVHDQNGVSKMGYFDLAHGNVVIQRQMWLKASDKQRYDLVMTELLGLAGYKDRYTEVEKSSSQQRPANNKCESSGFVIKTIVFDKTNSEGLTRKELEGQIKFDKENQIGTCEAIEDTGQHYLNYIYYKAVSGSREGDLVEVINIYGKKD